MSDKELERLRVNMNGMLARERKYKEKISALEKQMSSKKSPVNLDKLQENLNGLQARELRYLEKISFLEKNNRILQQQKANSDTKAENLRGTISFRLGNALLQAGKSWHGFARLPKVLLELRTDAQAKRNTKDQKVQPVRNHITIKPAIIKNDKRVKVAGVMDEFTFHSYAPECDILQLHPEKWEQQLENFKPDILFIESAWKGLDGLWQTKISNYADEIAKAIEWCKNNEVPTLFWNKEDPVHFSTFIPIAKAVDHVFTTDIDCIPKYKHYVGHDRVYLLPFAAQPKTHNPVEKYNRKDAFNFAGSYYLRYPERQKDFSSLIETVQEFKPVEIYDRNHGDSHPHYKFPDKYKSMILGKLPFTEIDMAYKGYRYGINMNTIKQSQTMFARRVFELLASNTVVVSNFSRGARLLFGDLIISSDNKESLSQRLSAICSNDTYYKKFRLLGLRRVMQEHTYNHRLKYILSKLTSSTFSNEDDVVIICAVAKSKSDFEHLFKMFSSQSYKNKKLLIVNEFGSDTSNYSDEITIFTKIDELIYALSSIDCEYLLGVMSPEDFYGDMYITDLQLASTYSSSNAFGKDCHYINKNGIIELTNENSPYFHVKSLCLASSLIRSNAIDASQLKDIIKSPYNNPLKMDNMLSIDEFNYIENGRELSDVEREIALDLKIENSGVLFSAHLAPVAESLPATANINPNDNKGLPQFDATELSKLFSSAGKIRFSLNNNKLRIQSSLDSDKHSYIYSKRIMSREEMNLVINSQFQIDIEGSAEIKTVFEFQDENGKKISHQMNHVGGKHSLAIPEECKHIRFGLRLQGPGEAKVTSLILGSNAERPAAILCKSNTLVLSKQYPAYNDLYKYGFLHSRIRAYYKEGVLVDILRLTDDPSSYREFENIDVANGDLDLLDTTLATGKIKHVLVHLIDERMWSVLSRYIDRIKVTVWIHGAEIQVWQRRSFEFERMTKEEVIRQKKLSDKRKKFWHNLLSSPPKNLHLVFVSQTFANEVMTDLDINIPQDIYSVIHNYVDTNMFPYIEKPANFRNKVLSIRSFASRKYGNDLSVKAIQALSKRPCFNDMTFHIVGDGELFDDTVNPLRIYKNVKIEKGFLSHNQISNLQNNYGIFLNPTRWDSQGVSRDEAMSSGLVPVTSRVAAVPEFVDDMSGRLVDAEDYYGLANALEELSENPELFSTLSKSASERTRIQCNYDQTIKKELTLFS